MKINGIHHVSSIVGHAQRNLDQYAGVLGMRLVKKTLNFDDSSTYHFYYGNEDGSSNLLTTFPWNDAVDGKVGSGQVGITSLAVNVGTLDDWQARLNQFKLESTLSVKYGQKTLSFEDIDGLKYELVESDKLPNSKWEFNGVDKNHAIKGIERVTLFSRIPQTTIELFKTIFNYEVVSENDEAVLLQVSEDLGGTLEIIKEKVELGQQGVGTVHHLALSIDNGDEDAWVSKLQAAGYRPTEVKDRKYFRSIYFREKGGILIELATVKPGVLVDESEENLGSELLIPPHYEIIREEIEATIMPVTVREVDKLEGYGYRDMYEYNLLREKARLKEDLLALKNQKTLSAEDVYKISELKKAIIKVK
ncbi:MAG: ring-cleaving dioxygenase [Erysipelothrix sp.]|nr:ring-cleaving dioxygenase [Erysipelothrix sp.]